MTMPKYQECECRNWARTNLLEMKAMDDHHPNCRWFGNVKKYIKISRPQMGSYIQPIEELASALDGEFDDSEEHDKITLELIYMREDEYEKLPEFEGW